MKNISIYLLVALGFLSVSCTKDFEDLNTNTNSPNQVAPQFLLSNVLTTEADQNTFFQGFRLSNYLTQFAASVEFERIDRYEMGTNSEYWNSIYHLLNDLESMKGLPGYNEAYGAVADIMKSYLFSQLTDMWSDVPYTEALQAEEGQFTAKYDTQESIYTDPQTGILAVLARSATTLQSTTASIQGDVMFKNDLNKWVRFANSLRLRYLMRISKRLSNFSEMQSLADSGMLMESNDQNAVVPYLASAPNQFPLFLSAQGLYQEHRMTKTVENVLTLWNDPRIAVLYKPSQKSLNDGNPMYNGLLNGQSRETIAAAGINLNDISLFGFNFRDIPDGIDGQFMQYAEVQFTLAEAVVRGYISGNAETFYQSGIAASFAYYDTELPADYFTREPIALTGEVAGDLDKILTQKWLMLNTNGHEAWFSVRRTGIPNLIPGPDNFNNDRYPVRYLYPESEQATNSANYSEAIQRIGGDNINSKGWWEKD